MLLFLGLFQLGFSIKVDKSFSEDLSRNFIEQIQDINETGIFLNNLKIALAMFIPMAGVVIGGFSAFSTGLIFNTITNLSSLQYPNPLIIFLTPFGILELVSYGIALSRGGIFLFEISKRRISKKSIAHLLAEVVLVSILLFIGALIEWNMIENIPKKLM
jgi:uncharacterized membrane protein SpoIIM required for sporulation